MFTVFDRPHFRALGNPGLHAHPWSQAVGSAPPRAHRIILRSKGVEAEQAGTAGVRCVGHEGALLFRLACHAYALC